MNDALRREVARWLRYAQEDLREARRLVARSDAVPRHPAWLAQQGAEKALKAVLVCEQIPFPRTHNLSTVFNLIPAHWQVREVAADLERLSEYAVESRYPADVPDITAAEAAEAVRDAVRLADAVTADLKQRLSEQSRGDS